MSRAAACPVVTDRPITRPLLRQDFERRDVARASLLRLLDAMSSRPAATSSSQYMPGSGQVTLNSPLASVFSFDLVLLIAIARAARDDCHGRDSPPACRRAAGGTFAASPAYRSFGCVTATSSRPTLVGFSASVVGLPAVTNVSTRPADSESPAGSSHWPALRSRTFRRAAPALGGAVLFVAREQTAIDVRQPVRAVLLQMHVEGACGTCRCRYSAARPSCRPAR